jgi:hypothetical protein
VGGSEKKESGMNIQVGLAQTIASNIVLDTAGAPYTGALAYTDFKISKAGGASAAPNASMTATHNAQGSFALALTAADTGTTGTMEIMLDKADYMMAPIRLDVVSAASVAEADSVKILRAILGGVTAITDNGDGTSTIAYKDTDGLTTLISVTCSNTVKGSRTASVEG